MSALLNTHFYDGKLVKRDTSVCLKLSLEECCSEIRTACIDEVVHRCLELFSNGDNFDTVNECDCVELLIASWERVRGGELEQLYFEQLRDIVLSGSCLQGRSARLMQFLL